MPAFDAQRGQLAHRLDGAGGRPGWEVAILAYSTDDGGGASWHKWAGLVAIDAEGFVVWYTKVAENLGSAYLQLGPFDQQPGSHRLAYGIWFTEKGGFPWPDEDDDAYGGTLTGVLVEVDAWGAVQHTTCAAGGARARSIARAARMKRS